MVVGLLFAACCENTLLPVSHTFSFPHLIVPVFSSEQLLQLHFCQMHPFVFYALRPHRAFSFGFHFPEKVQPHLSMVFAFFEPFHSEEPPSLHRYLLL